MNKEHFQALLSVAGAKQDSEGWLTTEDERLLTLQVSHNGVGLTVSKVASVRLSGDVVFARTSKGDQFVLALSDIFAASVEAPKEKARQAGFR